MLCSCLPGGPALCRVLADHRLASSAMHQSFLLAVCWLTPGLLPTADAPQLVSVKKIWDQSKHNAFTDLIRWRGKWYCTFREADAHVGGDGKLRVLESP